MTSYSMLHEALYVGNRWYGRPPNQYVGAPWSTSDWTLWLATSLWHAGWESYRQQRELGLNIPTEEFATDVEVMLLDLTASIATWPDAFSHEHHYISAAMGPYRYQGFHPINDITNMCSCGICRHDRIWRACTDCCAHPDLEMATADFVAEMDDDDLPDDDDLTWPS